MTAAARARLAVAGLASFVATVGVIASDYVGGRLEAFVRSRRPGPVADVERRAVLARIHELNRERAG